MEFYTPPQVTPTFIFAIAAFILLSVGIFRTHQSSKTKGSASVVTIKSLIPASLLLFSTQYLTCMIYVWLMQIEDRIPVLGKLISVLLNITGYSSSYHDRMVYLQNFKELLAFSITTEKLALLQMTQIIVSATVVLLYLGFRFWRSFFWSAGVVGVYGILRLCGLIVFYSDHQRLDMFWNPAWIFLSFIPLVLIISVFKFYLFYPASAQRTNGKSSLLLFPLGFLVFAGLSFAVYFQNIGEPKAGRVVFDEVHSDWEWTRIPFDRVTLGGQSTYNYRVLYLWFQHYFDVDLNEKNKLTLDYLKNYDVLILKTPTTKYESDEVDAIVDYVKQGGGLYLVGDHTNLFGMSTYLNQVAERFGFYFNYDDTYELTTGAPSHYAAPTLFPHPVVQNIDEMEFETTCTVKIPWYAERIITESAIGREWVDYGHVNFFGDIAPQINEEWGIFVLAGGMRYGKGRVVAFTDSTTFSNFSLFFHGVSELAMGCVHYLNFTNATTLWNWLAFFIGLISLLLAAKFFKRASLRIGLVAFFIGGFLGYIISGLAVAKLHRVTFPDPVAKKPYERIHFIEQYSEFRLATMLEYESPDAYRVFDTFFVNTQRINFYPQVHKELKDALIDNTIVVFINPNEGIPDEDLQRFQTFVSNGGKLLIMDQYKPDYSYLNPLLKTFDLLASVSYLHLEQSDKTFSVHLNNATPIDVPADVRPPERFIFGSKEYGKGKVYVILGSVWLSRQQLGRTFNMPSEEQQKYYALEYYVFDHISGTVNVPVEAK